MSSKRARPARRPLPVRPMKVGYLITARLKSTRLPRKLLREIQGRPVLTHMLDRLKLARRVDSIVVCTSPTEEDRPLIDLAEAEGVESFAGDPDDVIARLAAATEHFGFDYVLNITADCPFADPDYADRIVEAYESTGADLIRSFGLPHGAFSYGLKPTALKKVIEIKASKDTEVWGRYFTDTDIFRVHDLPIENPLHRWPTLRMTLDYPEDLRFFEAVFERLYQEGKVFSLDRILELLRAHPEIVEINRHCAKGYQRRFNVQSEISLKQRYQVSRALVVGSGSIGQRHLGNLRQLGVEEIVALRTREGHHQQLPAELGVRETDSWEEALDFTPDVAIVSNPTSLHLETARRLLPRVRGLFIEKPLAGDVAGVPEFLEAVAEHRRTVFVGYNLEFHPLVEAIHRALASGELGEPLILQAQVGHWLPDWHPYEDYRKSYAARADLGGGVALTLIHEVFLAQRLFGAAEGVHATFSASEALPLEVDAIADLMIRHRSGAVSQLHLDFIQRPYRRCGRIGCELGSVDYDFTVPEVVVRTKDRPGPRAVWKGEGIDPNQAYLSEMETFLRYVREGRVRHPLDAWRGAHNLAIVAAAKDSGSKGPGAILPDWAREIA